MQNNIEQVENFISAYNHLFGLFELTPEPILVANKTGAVCYCNSIFFKLFGYDASEIVGKPVEILLPKRYRDHHPKLMAKYWEHPFKRPMGTGVQPVGVKQNGDEIHLDISLSPIGKELVLCILKDVTEIIKAKNQEQQYSQLNTMGLLTSSIVHEIANPTQAICGATGLIKRHLSKSDADPYLVAKIEDISYAANKLIDLVKSFRLMLKADSEDGDLVCGSVGDAIIVARRLCAHKLVSVEFVVENQLEGDDEVLMTTDRLAQVFINLYVNASYAMKIANISKPQLLTQVQKTENSEIVVRVSDNGSGIPDDLQEKIFDPMFSTKPANQGTGLGLNICRNMIEKVGGEIYLVNGALTGACFELKLPTAESQ